MSGIIALVLFLGFIALCAWSIVADCRESKRNRLACEADSKQWLEKQKSLPRFIVEVKTKEHNVFYQTDPFEPQSEVRYMFNYYVHNRTTVQVAESFIEGCIKSGRYYHKETNTFIPMCEILSMQAKMESK